MRNPFEGLRPALEVMVKEGKILPATGQAVEDMMRPDQDEAYDRVRLGVEHGIVDILIESPNRELYVDCPAIHREEKHLFRYFLDGSARTFYLGNVVEGERQTAIHVSQVGAAAVLRDQHGHIKIAVSDHKFVLLMNKDELSFGDEIEKRVRAAGNRYEFVNLKEEDHQTEGIQAGKEPRSRAAHKANWVMRGVEKQIAEGLRRSDGEWLMLDGGLGSEYAKDWKEGKEYAGIVKSSWKELKFSVKGGRGAKQTINTYELLSSLKAGQRTLAFGLRDGLIATWFVRIRGPEYLDFPLMGVLRVELPNPTMEAVPSDLITEVSGALVAERCVSPHGKDARWHSHLYPIYLAEQAVKNGFVSTEVLKAGLKWPLYAV
jgi:catechol 2,3-dioxygenase-like lactoylglutathione lyase family enzyme